MSYEHVKEQLDRIHKAVHSGTHDVTAIDAAVAELRKVLGEPPASETPTSAPPQSEPPVLHPSKRSDT